MARRRGGDLQTLRDGAYRKVNARSYWDSGGQAGKLLRAIVCFSQEEGFRHVPNEHRAL